MGTAALPTYRDLRRNLATLMTERGEWAGCPVPIDGLTLHIEPSYPYKSIADVPVDGDTAADTDGGLEPGWQLLNSWYSRQRVSHVFVVRNAEGRSVVFTRPEERYVRRLELQLKSMQAAWAHDTQADLTALIALHQHISDEQLTQYMLLGQFIETSKRSRVTYVFRRARPTIAMRATEDGTRVIAVLCLHAIAYYGETFVGAMTPTDDVLAHLLLMRGDEPLYWRRANQHHPEAPEACL